VKYLALPVLLAVVGCSFAQYRDYTGAPFTAEFSAPPAVGPAERMKTPPPNGSYVALSLNAARRALINTKVATSYTNYRESSPEVFSLGGMNHIVGCVVDPATKDVILVGRREAGREPVTLDDFVVALRSRFGQGEWPLVSIDPKGLAARQVVRFEGGLSDTQFGADLLAADYTLKTISFGIEVPNTTRPPSIWNELRERAQRTSSNFQINSRFWFFPILPSVLVRDGVVGIRDVRVAVSSAIDSAVVNGQDVSKTIEPDDLGDVRFAKWFTDKFNEISSQYVSVNRLRGLEELTAVAEALKKIDLQVNLEYWLKEYTPRRVETPRTLALVRRQEQYGSTSGLAITLAGGVELTALALRVKSGDVSALRRAVLETRPSSTAITWSFLVGNWIIPVHEGALDSSDANRLYAEFAGFLARDHYDEAELCLAKLESLAPLFADEIKIGRIELKTLRFVGVLVHTVGSYGVQVANGALPRFAVTDKDFSIGSTESALNVLRDRRCRLYDVSLLEGLLLMLQGRLSEADAQFTIAIDLGDKAGVAQHQRGILRLMTGQRREGIADLEAANQAGPPDSLRQRWEEIANRAKLNPDGKTWRVYRSVDDGIEFSYPADWIVVAARDPDFQQKLRREFDKTILPSSYAGSLASIAAKTLGRGVVVFNLLYDYCVVGIELSELDETLPPQRLKQYWETLLSNKAEIARRNSMLKGFEVKKATIVDGDGFLRLDLTYGFSIDIADSLMPGTGRRSMVYQGSAPLRVARIEFTASDQSYRTIDMYICKTNSYSCSLQFFLLG
jgi:hypothetical protein